ncbi:MAG: MarR family transcriptional regulator [Clostridia bacterium]
MENQHKKEALKALLDLNPLIRRHLFRPFKKINRPINPAQFFTLIELSESGETNMSALSARAAVSCQQMTALMDGLVALGFVERFTNESCRRSVIAKITNEGRKYLQEEREDTLNQLLPALAYFSDDEADRLYNSATEITNLLNMISEV